MTFTGVPSRSFAAPDEVCVFDEAGERIPTQHYRLRIVRLARLKCFRIPVEVLNDARCIPTARRTRERFGTDDDGCREE